MSARLTLKTIGGFWSLIKWGIIYGKIGGEFSGHGTVNHSADKYVRAGGFRHTSTVDSFFALLKRAVYRQFHHVSGAHLHRYLVEADSKLQQSDHD